MGDALALRDYEGRGKLRKATGSCKRAMIRGCPNGATQGIYPLPITEYIGGEERTQGIETS